MDVTSLAGSLDLPGLTEDLQRLNMALLAATAEGNPAIVEPATRVVAGGGKRLRPILAMASATVGGGPVTDTVIMAGVAVELVHVGSLVHDDIIDHAETRRGVPTINATEGVNVAILVGDFLLSRAGKESARISQQAALVLADAIIDLCIGQSLETAELGNTARTEDEMLAAISGKTGALLRASCALGAHAGGLPEEQVAALGDFGFNFGLAFQLVDDVLDLTSTDEKLGKPVGNDVREGNLTLPVILALADPSEGDELAQLLDGPTSEANVQAALDLVRKTGAVEATLARVANYNACALTAIEGLPSSPVVDGLRRLPNEYGTWAIDRTVADDHRHLFGSISSQ